MSYEIDFNWTLQFSLKTLIIDVTDMGLICVFRWFSYLVLVESDEHGRVSQVG